jgi:hypothetical protein
VSEINAGQVGAVLGSLALVPAVFGTICPPLSRVRAGNDEGGDVAHSIGAAALTASVAVCAVALGLRSLPVLLYGGAMVLAYTGTYAAARNVPGWP